MVCGEALPQSFLFRADNMPAFAQGLSDTLEEAKKDKVTLTLKRCRKCGLAQLDCSPVDYYRDVIRAVGVSETMRELRRKDYTELIEKYGLAGKKWIEVGCGNGDLLKVLAEFPVKIYGTENNRDNANLAEHKLDGNAVIFNMFTETEDTVIPDAPFDCFMSFNFLEHQPDPVVMLKCIRNNLADDGYGIITVPSFEYILDEKHYYELIRDHIASYTEEALKYLCEECDFRVLESGRIGIGDTLRVVVQKKAGCNAKTAAPSQTAEANTVLNDNYRQTEKQIEKYVNGLKENGKTLALWGAGHQGFTLAATTKLGEYAECFVDSSQMKHGKYAPASGLRIISPDTFFKSPADVIMITAPGYVKEIRKAIEERLRNIEGCSVETVSIFDILKEE